MDTPRGEWTLSATAPTHEQLLRLLAEQVQLAGEPSVAPEVTTPSGSEPEQWWTTLPKLVGMKELPELLGVNKQTIVRWRRPGSGNDESSFPPDDSYFLP